MKKSGLFIDKAPDREAPPVEALPTEEGAVPVEVVPEMIPGEWFWTLKAKNGNIIAGNGGFNTSQSALKCIRATSRFFAKEVVNVYNIVTGTVKEL